MNVTFTFFNKNCLVTGGAGFIGSNFPDFVLNGANVVVLDNYSTGRRKHTI